MSTLQLASTRVRASFGVRGRLVMVLLAGRGAFRATSQLAPLVLAAAWGPARFGDYAGAIGVCAWAMFVAVSGEKAALKLLPRTRRLGPDVTRVILVVGGAPVAISLLAIGLALALSTGPVPMLVLTAMLWSTSVGLLQVAAGLHRLRGAAGYDAAAFVGLAAAVAVTTLLTAKSGWSPLTQLSLISAAALVVGLVSLVRLPDLALTRGGDRRVTRGVLRACVLLGLPELLGSVTVAVCYLALTVTGQATENGPFYVAAVISGICSAAVIYLLRLGQPAVSTRLRGRAALTARTRAGQLLGVAIAVSAACAAAMAALLASGGSPGRPLLAALTAVEIGLFALVTLAGYLVENTNDRAPVITSVAAFAGLGAAVLAAAALVPTLGAAGAMGALVVSLGAAALAMRLGLTRLGAERFTVLGFGRRRWDRAYRRVVRSSFATVPFYRERWALGDRDPATVGEVESRLDDLVPLAEQPGPRPAPGPRAGARLSARDPLPPGATAGATIHDELLGDLAVLRGCGHWHVDWRRLYARNTPGGVAFTLLRQHSPRLVDVVVTPGPLRLVTCPHHRTPGVTA